MYLLWSDTWESSVDLLLFLSSYILSTTSTQWFYGLNISHICPLLPILPTTEAIITISQLDNHNSLPNWSHYIQFLYTSVPQSGTHIPKSRQNDSLGCGTIMKVKAKVAQLYLTLCYPMGHTVHGILQARILEWVAYPFSRGSSWTRNQTRVFCIVGGFFINWIIREAWEDNKLLFILICLYKPIWKTTFY